VVSSHILYEVEAMTKRVLLVHNGRILAEGDVREIRDLLDEHPHTVSLRARDPRQLAASIVGWPNVLSVTSAPRSG
jgi:ABC-2 type transport system ATP-binding protein